MCVIFCYLCRKEGKRVSVCTRMCSDGRAFVGKIDLIKRLEISVAGQIRGKRKGRLFTLHSSE